MAAPGPGQSHFGSGLADLPVSGAEPMDAMKLGTAMTAITSQITPDTILNSQALAAVTMPQNMQSLCFPQTSMSSAFSAGQQAPPGTHSPMNITLGFPMNMNPGAMAHPFVQPISVGQICTTVAQSLGIPISQTILAVPNAGQGSFLSGPFSQLQPIIVSSQQQPVVANPFMGAPQNGSITPLAASPNTFSLNNITTPAILPKELIFENVTESGNESESNFGVEAAKQDMGDLADVESILNITSMDDGGIQNDIEMPESENSNVSFSKDEVKSNIDDPPATDDVTESPKPAASPTELDKMEEDSNSVTEEPAPEESSPKGEEGVASPEDTKCPEEEIKEESLSPMMEDNLDLEDQKADMDDPDDKTRFSMIDTADYNEDGIPVEYDQSEFNWEEYLLETGSTSVPPTAFTHVECSLQSGFVKGMKLEVPNKSSPNTYWVASVIMSCGQLLRLRYDGYEEDGSADFWSDLMTSEIHPVGWCSSNGRTLQPPDAIKGKFSDWKEFVVTSLTGARTAPSYLLDKTTGTTPVDQLKQGMKLEIQDSYNPTHVWLVQIIENVGGRLYLRYDGVESGTHDFWMFYLNERLHPIGWTRDMKYTYKPPKEALKSFSHCPESEIKQLLEEGLKMADDQLLPADIFKDQLEITTHKFQKGWKLEALNPHSRNQICPATIVEVFNKHYFLVQIDTMERHPSRRVQFSCHANSPSIFPVHWCQCKGLRLTPPPGWTKPDFSWPEYLSYCNARSAPDTLFDLTYPVHEFEKGMKLEAVNPDNPNQICAATITKIVDCFMWIHLDISMKIVASHIEHIESQNLFPVGWCESNGYQLKPPRKLGLKRPVQKRVAVVQPEMAEGSTWNEETKGDSYSQIKNGDSGGSGWCPKIYFNHRCFSGPYLSKGRISELPKCVGPGPINLVMKEVLSMLINVAYKSCRVLREIQMEGSPNPNMHQQVLKAKYKGKSYRATVEICKSTSQLEEFCRQICIKLECCPNLISPHLFTGNCPENCSQLTKTKYTYYYGKKKKKVGRPPGGHTNLEDGPKKPGKRRKRKKMNLVPKKVRMSHDDDDICDDDKDSVNSDTRTVDSTSTNGSKDKDSDLKHSQSMRIKRKYTHHVPPPSDIRTRGAKLPKYSFERRTHKKIMLPSHSSHHGQSHGGLSSKSHGLRLANKMKHSMKPKDSSGKKEEILKLEKNPLKWSLSDVVDFIKTTDCAHLARLFKEQEIDGQALLLLTLPTVQEHLDLKLGPAIKLCHHIERVKIAFYETFAK